ncbi:hypothetical protein A2U01_0102390, partial [Trifolium medium]|nr:hypothetical protein [Trifolium medium]
MQEKQQQLIYPRLCLAQETGAPRAAIKSKSFTLQTTAPCATTPTPRA